MTRQQQFFYDNAGTSCNPATETLEQGKERGALRLAVAEDWARDSGYEFKWIPDQGGCIGCDCGDSDCACANGTCEPEVCCMKGEDNHVVQSLGSICGATAKYRRVVEAELALEQMPDIPCGVTHDREMTADLLGDI